MWIHCRTMRWVPLLSVTALPPAECVCIAVSHPSRLYVTRDGIITHNTTTGPDAPASLDRASMTQEGPVLDADYTGPRWTYAMRNRPVGLGAAPKGYIIGSGGRSANVVHIPGGAANAALMLATAGLGAAYAKQGSRVIGINPGTTNTGRVETGLQAQAKQDGITLEEARKKVLGKIAMGRMAEPSEIAATVGYLASSKASYITGICMSMDGALHPVVV